MKIEEKLLIRFKELISEGERLLANPVGKYGELNTVNANKWGTSCMHILRKVFGETSPHYLYFELQFRNNIDEEQYAENALGILKGAEDDYSKELLVETKQLIESEIFEDFLEQAEYLCKKEYNIPAAVIAGFVLEDSLRRLCQKHSVSLNKQIEKASFNEMNTALVKSNIYNTSTMKLNEGSYGIRIDAAHGRRVPTTEEVKMLIQQVRNFISNHYI